MDFHGCQRFKRTRGNGAVGGEKNALDGSIGFFHFQKFIGLRFDRRCSQNKVGSDSHDEGSVAVEAESNTTHGQEFGDRSVDGVVFFKEAGYLDTVDGVLAGCRLRGLREERIAITTDSREECANGGFLPGCEEGVG